MGQIVLDLVHIVANFIFEITLPCQESKVRQHDEARFDAFPDHNKPLLLWEIASTREPDSRHDSLNDSVETIMCSTLTIDMAGIDDFGWLCCFSPIPS